MKNQLQLEREQIREIALFFYFSLLNEKLAVAATEKVILKLYKIINDYNKAISKGKKVQKLDLKVLSIEASQKIWPKFKKTATKQNLAFTVSSRWEVPSDIDLGPWRQFHKEADDEEFLTVIWSRVLAVSDEQISKGCNVSLGTVRHRVCRGLKILGEMNRLGTLDV